MKKINFLWWNHMIKTSNNIMYFFIFLSGSFNTGPFGYFSWKTLTSFISELGLGRFVLLKNDGRNVEITLFLQSKLSANSKSSDIFFPIQELHLRVAATHFSGSESVSAVLLESFASEEWPLNLVVSLLVEKVEDMEFRKLGSPHTTGITLIRILSRIERQIMNGELSEEE